jgi:hypothetical protein
MTDNHAAYRTHIDTGNDIIAASAGVLERLVDDDLASASISMHHRDDGPLTVRGYHEQRIHRTNELRRGDGGHTYYHFKGDEWTATSCHTEALTTNPRVQSTPNSVTDARNEFLNRLKRGVVQESPYDADDLHAVNGDIYDGETGEQLISCSWRSFSKQQAVLQRACWQNQRFNDAYDASSYLVSRDGIDPERFKDHVGVIHSRLHRQLNNKRRTTVGADELLQRDQTTPSSLTQQILEAGDNRVKRRPTTCIGSYAVQPSGVISHVGAGQTETLRTGRRGDPPEHDRFVQYEGSHS